MNIRPSTLLNVNSGIPPSVPQDARPVALTTIKSGPNTPMAVLGFIVAIAVALLLLAALWRYAQHRQRRREAEQHVRLRSRVPDEYYNRELVRAYYARYFDLPDNFPELGEPNFSVHRLGWFLGMVNQLGPTAVLNCSYLRPNARPGVASQVSTQEFWLDFELGDRRWVIWYPGKDYEVVERLWFGNHCVSSTSARRTHDEITSWLRRTKVANSTPPSAAPRSG